MLKRMRIVTSLLLVLAVFRLLQLDIGGLFFNALKNDEEKISLFYKPFASSNPRWMSWVALLQTRNTLNPRVSAT
ncbi:Tar ligand binding domain-containing protein [Escherichia coli]